MEKINLVFNRFIGIMAAKRASYEPHSPDVEVEDGFYGHAAPEMVDDELPCEACGAEPGVPCDCFEAEPETKYKVNLADDEALLDAGPDLGEYLSMWILSDAQKVALCRTYASYLVARGKTGNQRPGPSVKIESPKKKIKKTKK